MQLHLHMVRLASLLGYRSRLTIPSMFKIPMWNFKEPTHYSKRVGCEVPGAVAVLLSSKMWPAWRDVSKNARGVMRPRAQKQPQVKKEPCRVLDDVDYYVLLMFF